MMDESRGRGPRGRSRRGEEKVGFSCPAGPYHLPPLGCSGPVTHSPTRPQSSPPARSCTRGRYPADTAEETYSHLSLYLHQNMATSMLTSGLGTPPGFCCQNLLPGHHVRDCTDTGDPGSIGRSWPRTLWMLTPEMPCYKLTVLSCVHSCAMGSPDCSQCLGHEVLGYLCV